MCSRVRPLERAGGGFDCGYPVEVQVWVELPSPLPPHVPSVSLPLPHPPLFCADREGGDLCPRPCFASPWRWAPSRAFSFSGAPSGFFASFLSVRGVLWFCATGAVRRLWLCSWWWCCSCHRYVTVICVVGPTCAVAFLLGCEAPLALQLVVVVLLSLCHCVVGPTCAVAFLGPSSRDARRGRHSPRSRAPTLSTTSLHTEAPAMTANN